MSDFHDLDCTGAAPVGSGASGIGIRSVSQEAWPHERATGVIRHLPNSKHQATHMLILPKGTLHCLVTAGLGKMAGVSSSMRFL